MTWYGQNNPSWNGHLLGSGPATIGSAGCYLTGYTNVANIALNHQNQPEATVLDLNTVFLNNGRFINGDLLSDDALNGFYGCQYVATQWFPQGQPTDLKWFSDDPNTQDLLEIFINEDPNETHFVLYYSGHSDGDFMIVDSEDGIVKNLAVYGTPSQIIQKGIRYIVPAIPPPPAPEPDPAQVPLPVPAPTIPTPPPEPTPIPVTVTPPQPPQETPQTPEPPQTPVLTSPSLTTPENGSKGLFSWLRTLLIGLEGVSTVKTGYKTTEFWVAVYNALSPLVYQGFGVHLPALGWVTQIVASAIYIYSRLRIKVASAKQ